MNMEHVNCLGLALETSEPLKLQITKKCVEVQVFQEKVQLGEIFQEKVQLGEIFKKKYNWVRGGVEAASR